jgi:hypothetical protein
VSVVAHHRLRPTPEINNGEPAMSEAYASVRRNKYARSVWAAMAQRLAHSHEYALVNPTRLATMPEDPGDSAHQAAAFVEGCVSTVTQGPICAKMVQSL